jgi:hypothetical protein
MKRAAAALIAALLLAAPMLAGPIRATQPAGTAAPRLVLDAEVDWSDPWEHFGGWSGLKVSPDGRHFIVLSDRGSFATGALRRDADGGLDGAEITRRGRLHGVRGGRLREGERDAEGLAIDGQGRTWASFERFHRVRRYDDLDGPAIPVPSHPDFRGFQENSGLEALAFDAAGTLYAIPERSGALDRPFPVYRLRDGSWDRSWTVRRDGPFLPVDADFGPDGRFYLLERDFTWLGGFATRIRRFDVGPGGLTGEVTLLRTSFGELDNMEGLATWRDPEGRIRVTLLSDDNFFALQRTMLAEFIIEDG